MALRCSSCCGSNVATDADDVHMPIEVSDEVLISPRVGAFDTATPTTPTKVLVKPVFAPKSVDPKKHSDTPETFIGGGMRYKGQLAGTLPCGEGVLTRKDGSTYAGQLMDGHAYGHGVLTYLDGCRYEGQWQHDLAEGTGRYDYPDGSSYRGEWACNQKCGTVRCTFASLDTFKRAPKGTEE
eukprot:TRINITY_DN14727_c0_g1_i1.p1 TRINITY_DN14727_c0_g1~~TRINITY_DN14727_c0_g1_i1.p1  ORF type:complete len:211 (+),score=9.37 TRINITY_DN14727_c0_g1_i1:90-635(+)